MIEIIQAHSSHKKIIIDLLDEFIVVCHKLVGKKHTQTLREDYENIVLDTALESDDSVIFLAKDKEKYVGIVTVYKVSLTRRGLYDAEIEEMFVQESYQGSPAAQKLLDAATKWSQENDVNAIQLKSHDGLARAHSFYEKNGFSGYGKAFEKKL